MITEERFELEWNLELIAEDSKRRRIIHQRTHNIVTTTGVRFFFEAITAAAFGGTGFTRVSDKVVRYIGFGIGGNRQSSPYASASPYSTDYAGANVQTDSDPSVARLERPVRVSASPLYMKQVATPATFDFSGVNRRVTVTAVFSRTEINYGAYTSVPLSEIGLYASSADPTLPNGGAGVYPGGVGHLIAYDTFDPIHKSGYAITARWSFNA